MTSAAKLGRAKLHVDELDRLVREYVAAQAGRLVTTMVDERGRAEFRRAEIPQPPPALALTFGDFVQNARAALDHAMYAVATAVDPGFHRSGFPVVLDPKKYADEERRLIPSEVADTVRAVIRDAQPFQTGEGPGALLAQLHDLAIIDRHRAVTLTSTVVDVRHVGWMRTRGRDDDPEIAMFIQAVQAGDVLLRLPSRDEEPEATFTPHFELEVVLGEGDRRSYMPEVVSHSRALLDCVADLTGRIEAAAGLG